MRKVMFSHIRNAKPILYGEAPFGWKLSDDRASLIEDEKEQRILRLVRHFYVDERMPMRGIVDRLRKMKIVNRRARPFGLSGVWEMIHRRDRVPPEAKAGARRRRKVA